MQTWIETNREQHAELERQRTERKAANEQAAQDRMETRHLPMTTRIQRILRALPETERDKPRQLAFFQDALAPKFHGRRAAAREVSAGLQELGWRRFRQWKKAPPFIAVWYPPGQEPEGTRQAS